MRIGIDAMGSDDAPGVEIQGALTARPLLGGEDRIVLIGPESLLREKLAGCGVADWAEWIEIHHAGQVIHMDDSPVEALRAKPDSSIARMAQLHRDGTIDACISAGNTGACVAAAQMRLRRLANVHRPGIAIIMPTFHGPVALCDVGANVACKPQHLHQYAVMSSVYARTICGIQSPRVGLLSVGEEEGKGNDLIKRTHELMKADASVNFIGNVEGRDLFCGTCDVMVCDGFVGNVIIKLVEGMAEGVVRGMAGEMAAGLPPELAPQAKKAAKTIMGKYDYNEYGGAPLLGVDGICIICHGSSNHRGIMNAVRVAKTFSTTGVNERITTLLAGESR
ncbi:MAG: phosphate acyltransferase PlsX [Phycisphaerae bacterium]|nr:phosphate acyltransferase PlsX [Phycisphaerae bacterium]